MKDINKKELFAAILAIVLFVCIALFVYKVNYKNNNTLPITTNNTDQNMPDDGVISGNFNGDYVNFSTSTNLIDFFQIDDSGVAKKPSANVFVDYFEYKLSPTKEDPYNYVPVDKICKCTAEFKDVKVYQVKTGELKLIAFTIKDNEEPENIDYNYASEKVDKFVLYFYKNTGDAKTIDQSKDYSPNAIATSKVIDLVASSTRNYFYYYVTFWESGLYKIFDVNTLENISSKFKNISTDGIDGENSSHVDISSNEKYAYFFLYENGKKVLYVSDYGDIFSKNKVIEFSAEYTNDITKGNNTEIVKSENDVLYFNRIYVDPVSNKVSIVKKYSYDVINKKLTEIK